MKRVCLLLMLAASVSQAQYQMVQWSKISTNDTAKMAGANWGILSKFITFPDGSKITTAAITKQRLIDSLNASSPWLTQMTRSWQFDSTIQARQTDFPEIAVPANPAADKIRLFAVADADFSVLETITDLGIRNRLNQDVFRIARNTTGSPISAGQVVYFNGSTGNKPNFALAEADLEAAMPAIGVTTATVADNNYGEIMIVGRLTGIKTDYEGWSEGDPLYVSPTTPGGLTNVRPTHPNFSQWIGTVEVVHANNGVILINVQAMLGKEDGTNRNSYTIGDQGTGTKSLIFDGLADGTLSWNSAISNWGLTSGYLMLGTDTAATRAYARSLVGSYYEHGDTATVLLSKTRAAEIYQPIGTYIIPSDTTLLSNVIAGKQTKGENYAIGAATGTSLTPTGTSGQFGWLTRTGGTISPKTTTDTLSTGGTEQITTHGSLGFTNAGTGSGIATFVFDDGLEEQYWDLRGKFLSHGVPAVLAMTVNFPPSLLASVYPNDTVMTKAHLLDLQSDGWEIASHTYGHPHFRTLSVDSMDKEMQWSRDTLRAWGLTVNNLAYPYGGPDDGYSVTRREARKFYRSAAFSGGGLNSVIQNYQLKRIYPVSGSADKDTLKGHLAVAKARNLWAIFCFHKMDSTVLKNMLDTLILYCQAQGIPIVTLNQGLDRFGNAISLGDDSLGYTEIPRYGGLHIGGYATFEAPVNIGVQRQYLTSDWTPLFVRGFSKSLYLQEWNPSPSNVTTVARLDTVGKLSAKGVTISSDLSASLATDYFTIKGDGTKSNFFEFYNVNNQLRAVIDSGANLLLSPTGTTGAAIKLTADNKSKISGGANGAIAFNYNSGATGDFAFWGGGTSSQFGVTYIGLGTIKQLHIGGNQNSTLTPFTIKNFAGTIKIKGDTVGLFTAVSLAAGTATLTGTTTPLTLGYDGTNKVPFTVTSTGELYIAPTGKGIFLGGTTTATAKLHLAAGTAAASTAPLKFTAGTPLTTPEAGVLEPSADGVYLLWTRMSGVRDTLKTGGASATRLDSAGGWYRTGLIKTDQSGVQVMIRGTDGDTTSTSLLHVGGTMDATGVATFSATTTNFGTASSVNGQLVLRHASNASTTTITPSAGDGAVTLTTPNITGTLVVLNPATTQTFGANNVWNGTAIDTAYLIAATKYHNQAQWTITGLTDTVAAKPTRTELTTLLATKAASSHTHIQGDVTGLTDTVAAKPTRTELTTLLAAKQNTISNLADTLKYVEKLDSLIAATGYARNWQIDTKQNTIANLADTSKYVEGLDSLKGAGYATRTMLQADSLYRRAQELLRILYSDTTSTVTNQWRLGYKIGVVGYSVGDTSSFTTTATRKAIYVSGARDNQIWDAKPRIAANTTLPVAGDWTTASSKWDSVIVKRPVGTTSGLKFNYWRVR